jgi:hypothetical protein
MDSQVRHHQGSSRTTPGQAAQLGRLLPHRFPKSARGSAVGKNIKRGRLLPTMFCGIGVNSELMA